MVGLIIVGGIMLLVGAIRNAEPLPQASSDQNATEPSMVSTGIETSKDITGLNVAFKKPGASATSSTEMTAPVKKPELKI